MYEEVVLVALASLLGREDSRVPLSVAIACFNLCARDDDAIGLGEAIAPGEAITLGKAVTLGEDMRALLRAYFSSWKRIRLDCPCWLRN